MPVDRAVQPVEGVQPEPCQDRPACARQLTPAALWEAAWASAWEAAWQAFMVQLLGGLAVGIAAGLCRGMVPSMPPGFAVKPDAESDSAPAARNWHHLFYQYQFAVIFGILFTGKFLARLASYSAGVHHHAVVAWFRRFSRRLSNNWFGLIVGNAFTAWVTVVVLQWTQQFSWTHWIWQGIWDVFQPAFHSAISGLPGSGWFQKVGRLFSWYNQNQLKFTFWFIYMAGICDDLGLPNLKTFVRWLRRRWFNTEPRSAQVTPSVAQPTAGPTPPPPQ